MNPFDMFGGDFNEMMAKLSGQLGGEGTDGIDGLGNLDDLNALAQQLGVHDLSDLQGELNPEDLSAVQQSMANAGVSEEELNAAAQELNAQLENGGLSALTQQMQGADYNNLMVSLSEQMQGNGFMGKMMKKLTKQFEEARQKTQEVTEMDTQALDALSDDDLIDAIAARMEREPFTEPADPIDYYTGTKRIFYIVHTFMWEMDEGGLSQYLVNNAEAAADLPAALEAIHADEIADMLRKFAADNGFALDSLSADSVEQYIELTAQYDFDSWEDAYYRTEPPIGECLANYCRAHLEDF